MICYKQTRLLNPITKTLKSSSFLFRPWFVFCFGRLGPVFLLGLGAKFFPQLGDLLFFLQSIRSVHPEESMHQKQNLSLHILILLSLLLLRERTPNSPNVVGPRSERSTRRSRSNTTHSATHQHLLYFTDWKTYLSLAWPENQTHLVELHRDSRNSRSLACSPDRQSTIDQWLGI